MVPKHDPQQSSEVFAQEHLGDQNVRVHGPQTVPTRIQFPIGMAGATGTSASSQHLSQVAKALGTATQGRDSPWGIISSSDSGHNLSGSLDESDLASPDEGGENQSIDMNALREEIKETISATIKDKLCSDADSVTTISQSMIALKTNAQYWSNLSNKVTHCSCRALELQLKMAEEKANTLLYKEAPEEVLLEAAWEAHNIHFQLDQNTCLCEAGLMPEQQVRFRTDTGGNINNISRDYGVNPIQEMHIARHEADALLPQQSTSALSMTAHLDGAVVNRITEYSGIQQMVRQAVQNALHETKPEKSFLAKAGVKMGNPPT
ncbi:hypothetical protein M422DRAFT_246230 [Sphaerobolus stellatus SS14]|nr:hypothetical protein M422DRAFT_246230 [Sphaerobolus stellatus SS14]